MIGFSRRRKKKTRLSDSRQLSTMIRRLEPTFSDVVPPEITARNVLRLRVRAATKFLQVMPGSFEKLVHISLCGRDSLQFSDSMSDVTCAVVQTPAETHYNITSYSQAAGVGHFQHWHYSRSLWVSCSLRVGIYCICAGPNYILRNILRLVRCA